MTFKMSEIDQTITVYNLRSDTNEFIGIGDAYIPAYTGLPANCTTIKPPIIQDGFAAIFDTNNKKWLLYEDHRGENVFDIENGNKQLITELGPYPVGTTNLPPENQWQKWNGRAWVNDSEAEHNAHVRDAELLKNELMKLANINIEILQDAIDFDMATEEDKSLLTEWRKFRIELNRLNLNTAPAISWPAKPEK
ncbi:TPA: tail fiber assembly protein [Citrobacter sedlakii]